MDSLEINLEDNDRSRILAELQAEQDALLWEPFLKQWEEVSTELRRVLEGITEEHSAIPNLCLHK